MALNKICLLTESLSPESGWGRYSLDLAKVLTASGVKCLILTQKEAKNEVLAGVEVKTIISSTPQNFLKPLLPDYLRIKKYIKDCDLIHSLIEPYAPLACLAAGKKPFFITAHGTFAVEVFNRKKLKFIFSKVFKKAKTIFAVSNFTKKKILDKINLDNVVVINNGIDYQKFQLENFEPKINETKIILSVGVVKARKGYHVSIPAIAKVRERIKDLKYYIVGNQIDLKYLATLNELVTKLNLKNVVVFLNDLSDEELIKLYHQADLFLLTPVNIGDKFEGFGLVYLEAGACGKPVIGTTNCGAEDAVSDGQTGFLVPPDSQTETAGAIIRILSDNQLAKKLGENGRQQARLSDWKNICKNYVNIYKNY